MLLKKILKKLPLLCMILAMGLLFRVAGLVRLASGGAEYQFLEKPVYTLALDGIAEALRPSGNDAPKQEDVAEQNTEEVSVESAEPAVDTAAQTAEEETQSKVNDKKAKRQAMLSSIKGYVSAEKEAKILKQPLKEVIARREKASENTYIHADHYPEKAMRPVMHAVDYNIADPVYIDPEGTTYEAPDGVIFAENNDYYKFRKVDDSYFRDALFVGDSLSDGMYEYGGLRDYASFFAMESLSVYDILDVEIPFRSPLGGYTDTLEGVLTAHKFGKIYICLGMNEMGVPKTTEFRDQYKVVIEQIRKLQPKAIIYIQGILHVNYLRSMGDPVYNNKAVVQRNEAISKMANGHDIFYLEPSEALCNGEGNMIDEYTNDGVHPVASYYPLWHDYLNKYAIVRGPEDQSQ